MSAANWWQASPLAEEKGWWESSPLASDRSSPSPRGSTVAGQQDAPYSTTAVLDTFGFDDEDSPRFEKSADEITRRRRFLELGPVSENRGPIGRGEASAYTPTLGERTSDLAGDVRLGLGAGIQRGLGGLARAPIDLANFTFRANIPQPDAIRGAERWLNEAADRRRDRSGADTIQARQELSEADSFTGVLGTLLRSPRLFLTEGSEVAGMLVPGGLAGRAAQATRVLGPTGSQVVAQGAMAGGLTGGEVDAALRAMPIAELRKHVDFDQIKADTGLETDEQVRDLLAVQRSSDAAGISFVANSALPYAVPGGTTIERALGGAAAAGTSRVRNAITGSAGEFVSEGAAGGIEQVAQNAATFRSMGEGVGAAVALEGALSAPIGAATGLLQRPAAPLRDGADLLGGENTQGALASILARQAEGHRTSKPRGSLADSGMIDRPENGAAAPISMSAGQAASDAVVHPDDALPPDIDADQAGLDDLLATVGIRQFPAEVPMPASENSEPALGTAPVDIAASDAATNPGNDLPEPTEAQKRAGNYKLGHVRIGGLNISIENPAGSRRRPEWEPLAHHYGYIRSTTGKDGDSIDVFVRPGFEGNTDAPVFVVDQVNADGAFDEHKVLMGFQSEGEAIDAYHANYEPDWQGFGGIRQMAFDEFKAWTKRPRLTKRPVSTASSTGRPADADPLPAETMALQPSPANLSDTAAATTAMQRPDVIPDNAFPSAGTPMLDAPLGLTPSDATPRGAQPLDDGPVNAVSGLASPGAGAVSAVQSDAPAASRGAVGARATPETVRAALADRLGARTLETLEQSGALRIVASQADLPGRHAGTIRGMHRDGAAWLVAENLDADTALGALLHEHTHESETRLDTVLGQRYTGLLDRFQRLGNGLGGRLDRDIAAQAERLAQAEIAQRRADGLPAGAAELNAERLAHFIELAQGQRSETIGMVARQLAREIEAAIRQWLLDRKHLPEAVRQALADSMTAADFARIARRSVRESATARGGTGLSTAHHKFARQLASDAGATPAEVEQARKAWRDQGTDSPYFRDWFGRSKVVRNGQPIVVHHGTASDFNAFSADRAGSSTGHMTAPLGNFFTEDRRSAERYAEKAADGMPMYERVIDSYLNVQNPAELTPEQFQAIDSQEQARQFRSQLEQQGHDGIHIPEWGQWVVFQPNQIKSATDNRGTFDATDPDIRFARVTRQDAEARAELRRDEVRQTLGGPTAGGAVGWSFNDHAYIGSKASVRRSRVVLDDKMLAWRDVQDVITDHLGEAIPDAQNVWRLENLMHGRVHEGIDRLERERIVPLIERMRALDVTVEQLEEYLYARHAKERNAQIAKINKAMPDGGSGMTNADADVILAGADSNLAELGRMVNRITRQTRNRLLHHGLISQEQFDAMEAQYRNYVPLRGHREEPDSVAGVGGAGRGLDTRTRPFQDALGRGAGNRAKNILGEIIGDAQRSIILGEKARVGRAVMRIVLANPNPALWQVEPVITERRLDANGEVYEAVVNDWSDPSIVAVRNRGKVYRVQFNSPALARALNNVGVEHLGLVTRLAGGFNRYLSAMLTRYNPVFLAVNGARDAVFGLSGLLAEHGVQATAEAFAAYPSAARASWRAARGKSGKTDATKAWDTWAREFAEAGGKTGLVHMPSVEDLQRKIGTGRLTSYSPTGLAQVARSLADVVEAGNDAIENALRLSAYFTLRKRGASKDRAAEYAKNITVNFNRKGEMGTRLNAWFIFANAAIQGSKRVGDLLRNPKVMTFVGTLAGAQIMAALAAMGMEDDDGELIWDKIPDHVKRRNLVIVTPNKGVITVPMPYGFNWFTYAAGRITGSVFGRDDNPRDGAAAVTGDLMSAVVEAFSPVPLDDGAMGLIPTIARIPLNVQANRNDFGNSIRQEREFSKHDIPRASLGRADTLEIFKLAATGLNRIGGGNDYTPPSLSWFDVAPEDLQYLLTQLTGGAGRFVVQTATFSNKALGSLDDPGIKVEARDVPIANRFWSGIDENAAQQSLFYERRDTIERSLARVRDTFERDGQGAARELLVSMPELTGADLRRNKQGAVVVTGRESGTHGRPQIVARNPTTLFGRYKAASDATSDANERIRGLYAEYGTGLRPNRERDRRIRELQDQRAAAQQAFTRAWNETVNAWTGPED